MTRDFFRDTVLAWIVALAGAAFVLHWLPKGWYQSLVFGIAVGLAVGAAQSRHLGEFVEARKWIAHSVVAICSAFVVALSVSIAIEAGFVSSALIGAACGALIGFGQVTSILVHVRKIGPWLKACAIAFGATAAIVSTFASTISPPVVFTIVGAVAFGAAQAWLFRRLTEPEAR